MSSLAILDENTLVVSISIISLLMAALTFCASRSATTLKLPLRIWGLAMAFIGLGFLLFIGSGQWPLLLTFVTANTLVVSGGALTHVAFLKLLHLPLRLGVVEVLAVFSLSGVLAEYFFDAGRRQAVVVLSAGVAVMLGWTCVLIAQSVHPGRSLAARLTVLVTGVMASGFALRALAALIGDSHLTLPRASSMPQLGALVLGMLYAVGASTCFLMLVHERQQHETQEATRRDDLSGVHTRASLFEQGRLLSAHSSRSPYAVLMADIDHFKSINDTYGHRGGDQVIQHLARLLQAAARRTDTVGRYGGEEFCVLLPACDAAGALNLARRLVRDVAKESVHLVDGRTIRYTLSVGYAVERRESDGQPEPFANVVARADQGLYHAKRMGRNQAQAVRIGDADERVADTRHCVEC